MAKPAKIRKVYVRTTTRLRGSLERVKGNLRAEEPYLSRESSLTQEAIVNASWMWMAEMEPGDLARQLAPYIARFEELWEAIGPDPKNTVAEDEGPAPPKRRSRRA